MLIAFQTKDPNGNGKADEIPLSGVVSWHGSLADYLINPFVYYQTVSSPSGYYLEDGSIKAPFVEDGWKEGLKYLNKLYAQGLIDPQAFTNTEDQAKALGESPDVAILGAMPSGHEGIFNRDQWSKRPLVGIHSDPALGGANRNSPKPNYNECDRPRPLPDHQSQSIPRSLIPPCRLDDELGRYHPGVLWLAWC